MMLCLVVTQVFLSWVVVHGELSLYFAIKQPKISHFHRTGALTLHSIVDDTHGGGVITVDGNGGLGMAHF